VSAKSSAGFAGTSSRILSAARCPISGSSPRRAHPSSSAASIESSNLVFGQPTVVLRNEKATSGADEDAASIPARFVGWPKMIGSLLAYRYIRYSKFLTEVAEM